MTASLDATLTASRTPAGLSARYIIPISDDGFFVTTSGKIQRGAFQQAFRAGVYSRAVRALDLALATSPFAAPDFFAAPVWVRKEPPLTALPPGACGTDAPSALSQVSCFGRPPASPGAAPSTRRAQWFSSVNSGFVAIFLKYP